MSGELFYIPPSNPTIQTFREQQDLNDIQIHPTWINSKSLRVMAPLSKVNQDPWDEKASISAQCGDGHPLEIEDQGGDDFTISLPKISDVHIKVGTAGSFKDWVINKPFSIEQGEDDSRGNPTFVLSDYENSAYNLKIYNQTRREEINRWQIGRSSHPTPIPLLTRAQWLSIEETSTLALEIFQTNQDEPFHVETAIVEPAPISKYSPSITRQIGEFSDGRQTMEIHLSELHLSQRNSSAQFNWVDEIAAEVNIINEVFTLPVPMVKSEEQGFLVIPAQRTRLMIEPYSACSEDTCTFEQTRKSVRFSSDQAEELFLTVDRTGDWEGNICVELAREDDQGAGNDVLMSQSLPLPRYEQTIEMDLAWLLKRIPDLKSHVLDAPLDARFELNVHVFCGEDEEDRSERISTQLFQPESIIKIGEDLYFDEGKEEHESVVFTYDRFYFEEDDEFTLEIPGHEFVGTARGGEIAFEIYHPSIDQMDENSVWKLINHGRELLSGPYVVWPVEVHPPEKEATILVDPSYSSVSYPESLYILQSIPLPSSFEMILHLQIGSMKPKPIPLAFLRSSAGESASFKQPISMSQFFGQDAETRNRKWLAICREYGQGKIGEYWVELPTRKRQGNQRKLPLFVKIDANATYIAVLRYLKQQAAACDMKSVTGFLNMDLEHKEVVEDIIFIVLKHVYCDTEAKRWQFSEALHVHRGRPAFWKVTQEFRGRMKHPFLFFHGLFGEEVRYNKEAAEFMADAQKYFDRPTTISKDDLERLWEVVENE